MVPIDKNQIQDIEAKIFEAIDEAISSG